MSARVGSTGLGVSRGENVGSGGNVGGVVVFRRERFVCGGFDRDELDGGGFMDEVAPGVFFGRGIVARTW